jgi:hypothetical protein
VKISFTFIGLCNHLVVPFELRPTVDFWQHQNESIDGLYGHLIRSDTTDKVKSGLRQKRKRVAWVGDLRMNLPGIKPF